MRIPLPVDFISRDGSVDQDAGMRNCFMDGKDVVKRPAVNSNLVDVTGTAQGGTANNSKVYIINGDTLRSYNSSFVIQETIIL